MAKHGGALMSGDWNGDDGGGYHWHLHVAPIASATSHLAAGAPVALALYLVSVTVSWPDGDQTRQIRLISEQIGQPVSGG
jgi:hypothetical protein